MVSLAVTTLQYLRLMVAPLNNTMPCSLEDNTSDYFAFEVSDTEECLGYTY